MSKKNEKHKQQFFCPQCKGKKIIFRGKYLPVRSKNRIRKELSARYIAYLQRKAPDLYKHILADNEGVYPTREQLVQWYSSQRLKCLSCSLSFLSTDSRLYGHDQKKISQQARILQSHLTRCLEEKFISKNGFIKLFKIEELEQEKGFPVYRYDIRTLKTAYSDKLESFRIKNFIRKIKEIYSKNFHFFMSTTYNPNLQKRVKVIFCIDVESLKIRDVFFYDEAIEIKNCFQKCEGLATQNLPDHLRKKAKIPTGRRTIKEIENSVKEILKASGFSAAAGAGSTIAVTKILVSQYVYRYNSIYLKKFRQK